MHPPSATLHQSEVPRSDFFVKIATKIAEFMGEEATSMPPLQNFVECDALEALLEHEIAPKALSFGYNGLEITIRDGISVEIRE